MRKSRVRQVVALALIGQGLSQVAVASPNYFTSLFDYQRAKYVGQLGGFDAHQGRSQNIGISGLIGDQFNVTKHDDQSAVFGVGYFIDAYQDNRFDAWYGLNAFLLGDTKVYGTVTQEGLFTNLDFQYTITNYPIYLAGKAFYQFNDYLNLTFDLGVGPNIIHSKDFSESSRDGGITLPDNMFHGQTDVAVSATIGVGLSVKNILGCMPFEIGYRFFYLGEGQLSKNTSGLSDELHTGHSYANAIIFSISN